MRITKAGGVTSNIAWASGKWHKPGNISTGENEDEDQHKIYKTLYRSRCWHCARLPRVERKRKAWAVRDSQKEKRGETKMIWYVEIMLDIAKAEQWRSISLKIRIWPYMFISAVFDSLSLSLSLSFRQFRVIKGKEKSLNKFLYFSVIVFLPCIQYVFPFFFNSLARSTYLSLFSFSILPWGRPEQQSQLFGRVIFVSITRSGLLVEIRWSVSVLKPQRNLCISFQDVHLPFVLMINFKLFVNYPVDHLPHQVVSSHEFFASALAGGLSVEYEWQQFSLSPQDSFQYSGRSQLYCSLEGLDSSSEFQLFQLLFHANGDRFKCANYNLYHRYPHVLQLF